MTAKSLRSGDRFNDGVTPSSIITAEVLAVGGGGGAGWRSGGGGGGGIAYHIGKEFVKGTSYTVTIGNGGTAASTSTAVSSSGGDSSVNGVTAYGGGYGSG